MENNNVVIKDIMSRFIRIERSFQRHFSWSNHYRWVSYSRKLVVYETK